MNKDFIINKEENTLKENNNFNISSENFNVDSFSLNEFDEIDSLFNDKNDSNLSSKDLLKHEDNSFRKLNSVEFYLKSISKYPLINEEEVKELSRRIQNNDDKEALRKLVVSNLRLAFKIAKNYSNYTKTPLEELIQVANEGLLYSAYNFKEEKNVKFSTFATLNIKSVVLKFINVDNKQFKISSREFNKINDINRFIKKFIEIKGIEPTNEEIYNELKDKYSLKQIKDVRNMNLIVLNLDENFEDGTSLNDLISNQNEESLVESINKKDDLDFIHKELDCLSSREKSIVLDYCNGESFTDIGKKLGLTKQRIQQIFTESVKKIKENVGNID